MDIIICPTAESAARWAAEAIARAIRAHPTIVLGLATGRTMESVYEILVELHRTEGLDFSRCRTFNLDEYVGIPADHPGSYHYYMNQRLFRHVNIDPHNTHLPNGMAPDLDEECRRYEALIAKCGGIDLQLLGLGKSGHIGFNEPLSPFYSRTRIQRLTATTIAENRSLFPNPDEMPEYAITMGVGTILDCRRLLMLVTGESKADVLARTIEGPLTALVPASAIQFHPDCTVVVDEAAAVGLRQREYYRCVSSSQLEWKQLSICGAPR